MDRLDRSNPFWCKTNVGRERLIERIAKSRWKEVRACVCVMQQQKSIYRAEIIGADLSEL